MNTSEGYFSEFSVKMRDAGLRDASIRAFQDSYRNLIAGQTGMIPESEIEPVEELPRLEAVARNGFRSPQGKAGRAPSGLLAQAVVLKLNGGLGTSMGLEKAKSLLEVKDGLNFLDFIARQVLQQRRQHGVNIRFLLMNSFSTSRETLEFLKKYPELGDPRGLELMQSQVPKVDSKTLRPIAWPENPQLEWCPPGHGDLYPSLLGSGVLERLLAEGCRYLFVSNSDNLGATLNLDLLGYFADSGKSFLMEVAQRTSSDRKGGHLARRGNTLLLRESAQCPPADQEAFQDIQRHRFFNTNNLWIRLDKLREFVEGHAGFVPLPLIKNAKTVDPRNKKSPAVFQLETAMGAAIECFENAGAIVVPRSRFAPVKTTSDLLALRSDAYEVTQEWRLQLSGAGAKEPPKVDLDNEHYRLVDQLDEKLKEGVPSLKQCRELTVRGPVAFSAKNIFRGTVSVSNSSTETRRLPAGNYTDQTVVL